jgi:hypothetical protein
MCGYTETDVRESANDSNLARGEGHDSCGETCHLIYGESPVSSVAEHPLPMTKNPIKNSSHDFEEMEVEDRNCSNTMLGCSPVKL